MFQVQGSTGHRIGFKIMKFCPILYYPVPEIPDFLSDFSLYRISGNTTFFAACGYKILLYMCV